MVCWDSKVNCLTVSQLLFFCNLWSCCRDQLILLYFKTPDNFMHLILQKEFHVVHIAHVHIVKFHLHNYLWITLSTQSCQVSNFLTLIRFVRLLYVWSFRLYHYRAYIFYFSVLSIFFKYSFSLWSCFVQQLEEIQFFSGGFPFLFMSKSFRLRFSLFVFCCFFFLSFFSNYCRSVDLCLDCFVSDCRN